MQKLSALLKIETEGSHKGCALFFFGREKTQMRTFAALGIGQCLCCLEAE